jgi:uncharacterized protein (TIGR02452 family)
LFPSGLSTKKSPFLPPGKDFNYPFDKFSLPSFITYLVENVRIDADWCEINSILEELQISVSDSTSLDGSLTECQQKIVEALEILISDDHRFIVQFDISDPTTTLERLQNLLKMKRRKQEVNLLGLRKLENPDRDTYMVFLKKPEEVTTFLADSPPFGFHIERVKSSFLVLKPKRLIDDFRDDAALLQSLWKLYFPSVTRNAPPKFSKDSIFFSCHPQNAEKSFASVIGQSDQNVSFLTPEVVEQGREFLDKHAERVIRSSSKPGNPTVFQCLLWPSTIPQLTSLPTAMTSASWWNTWRDIHSPEMKTFWEKIGEHFDWDGGLFQRYYKTVAEDAKDERTDPVLCRFRMCVAAHTKRVGELGYYYYRDQTKQVVEVKLPFPGAAMRLPLVPLKPLTRRDITLRPSETPVQVIDSDSFNAAWEYLSNNPGDKVLVLNMANQHVPGGGWNVGTVAQEEDLFRRSNLSYSLEDSLYPIDEFGGLICTDVSVFRGGLETGFALLPEPFQCDVISVCGYDQGETPDLLVAPTKGGAMSLSPAYISKIYRKFLSLFHYIAQTPGYDYVVLGALGCGVFQNPPADIAQIFSEVIQLYAGRLPPICFAILKSQTTMDAFQNTLKKCYAPKPDPEPIFYLDWTTVTLCDAAGQCLHQDEEDKTKVFHPRKCPFGKSCKYYENPIHRRCCSHPIPCELGAQCLKWSNTRHCEAYIHPEKCSIPDCTQPDHWHEAKKPAPLPDPAPAPVTRRLTQPDLPPPTGLVGPRDEDHVNDLSGSASDRRLPSRAGSTSGAQPAVVGTLKPCRHLLACHNHEKEHRELYSHCCAWGESCLEFEDPNHMKYNYHFVGHKCPDGINCKLVLSEEHLDSYSHPGVQAVREPCKLGEACPNRSIDHVTRYSHALSPNNFLVIPAIDPTPFTRIKARITYFYNVGFLQKQLHRWLADRGTPFVDKTPFLDEIATWLHQAMPTTRLSKDMFSSALKSGVLLSSHQLLGQPSVDAIFPIVLGNPEIQNLLLKVAGQVIPRFIRACIELKIAQLAGKDSLVLQKTANELRDSLDKTIGVKERSPLEAQVLQITEAVCTAPKPIDRKVFQIVGTDKHVFAINGPQRTGPEEIVLILKNSVKYHPQFFLLPLSAPYFYDENNTHTAVQLRPWAPDNGPNEWKTGLGEAHFHTSKLHPIASDCWKILALELVVRIAARKRCPWTDVTLAHVQHWWSDVLSTEVPQAHLPYVVPLHLVEKVIMPKAVWDGLSHVDQANTNKMFEKSKICIVKSELDVFSTQREFSQKQVVLEGIWLPPSSIPRELISVNHPSTSFCFALFAKSYLLLAIVTLSRLFFFLLGRTGLFWRPSRKKNRSLYSPLSPSSRSTPIFLSSNPPTRICVYH